LKWKSRVKNLSPPTPPPLPNTTTIDPNRKSNCIAPGTDEGLAGVRQSASIIKTEADPLKGSVWKIAGAKWPEGCQTANV